MDSYSIWPWVCKQSSLRGQFNQIPNECICTSLHPWWYAAMHPILVACAMCASATTPIQRRWMELESIHLRLRVSAWISISPSSAHEAEMILQGHIALEVNEKMFFCCCFVCFFCYWPFKIFLTRAIIVPWVIVALIRYSGDAAGCSCTSNHTVKQKNPQENDNFCAGVTTALYITWRNGRNRKEDGLQTSSLVTLRKAFYWYY